jgi:hypothetical protein
LSVWGALLKTVRVRTGGLLASSRCQSKDFDGAAILWGRCWPMESDCRGEACQMRTRRKWRARTSRRQKRVGVAACARSAPGPGRVRALWDPPLTESDGHRFDSGACQDKITRAPLHLSSSEKLNSRNSWESLGSNTRRQKASTVFKFLTGVAPNWGGDPHYRHLQNTDLVS